MLGIVRLPTFELILGISFLELPPSDSFGDTFTDEICSHNEPCNMS